jgi:hypothetical protein
MADAIVIKGAKEALTILRNTEPLIYKQLNKDIERIVKPAKTQIVSTTPFLAPLSGMMGSGRTSWTGVRVKTVKSFTAKSNSKLVQLRVEGFPGAGFEIADMAGRGSGRGRRPKDRTRVYPYKGGSRSHRLNGQGQAMIQNLSGRASRYTYPAVERMLPNIQTQVLQSIEVAAAEVNRKLKVI